MSEKGYPFRCAYCGKCWLCLDSLVAHVKLRHADKIQGTTLEEAPDVG